jgi:hypothetical protein
LSLMLTTCPSAAECFPVPFLRALPTSPVCMQTDDSPVPCLQCPGLSNKKGDIGYLKASVPVTQVSADDTFWLDGCTNLITMGAHTGRGADSPIDQAVKQS